MSYDTVSVLGATIQKQKGIKKNSYNQSSQCEQVLAVAGERMKDIAQSGDTESRTLPDNMVMLTNNERHQAPLTLDYAKTTLRASCNATPPRREYEVLGDTKILPPLKLGSPNLFEKSDLAPGHFFNRHEDAQ
ncbi:predicted protein [Histoplasma capsulatum var. duboisii H88]|uniref:Predicted protein n=2 Tax=Ajellomyces capsulatus TaxID=5037 RepID=F0UAC8_AJEC8|nr:predicted protein [Histoplasma capsulatum H143]EGC42847.1 predicted protein [Histoplasma capsulatum var. duboisii H88]